MLPIPQLKTLHDNMSVPSNHIFPLSRRVDSYSITDKELSFSKSGNMTIEEKQHFLIKINISRLIHWLYSELFYTSDDNLKNMFLSKIEENMTKYDNMNKHPPTQSYRDNTGSYF
jgi:hypothetical protein